MARKTRARHKEAIGEERGEREREREREKLRTERK
jgi:hypothetical protein